MSSRAVAPGAHVIFLGSPETTCETTWRQTCETERFARQRRRQTCETERLASPEADVRRRLARQSGLRLRFFTFKSRIPERCKLFGVKFQAPLFAEPTGKIPLSKWRRRLGFGLRRWRSSQNSDSLRSSGRKDRADKWNWIGQNIGKSMRICQRMLIG